MLSALSDRISARPRRVLLVAALFTVLAAVVGGPVFGLLDAGGGFTDESSDSAQAVERLDAATGQRVRQQRDPAGAPGRLRRRRTRTGRGAPLDRQADASPGRVRLCSSPATSGDPALRLARRARDLHRRVAGGRGRRGRGPVQRSSAASSDREGRDPRRRAVRQRAARRADLRGPRSRRAAGVPAADPAVDLLLPRRSRRGPAAGDRRHHRPDHVPDAARGRRVPRPVDLLPEPGHRDGPRAWPSTTRCSCCTATARSSSAAAPGPRPCATRWPPPGARSCSARSPWPSRWPRCCCSR